MGGILVGQSLGVWGWRSAANLKGWDKVVIYSGSHVPGFRVSCTNQSCCLTCHTALIRRKRNGKDYQELPWNLDSPLTFCFHETRLTRYPTVIDRRRIRIVFEGKKQAESKSIYEGKTEN